MGFFSRFEHRVEDGFENAADKMFDAPISPVQISKKAEKAMRREKMVSTGKQFAPTLYTVLVNPQDDQRLFGYYPTLAGETETYLAAKAVENGLVMDGQPLVRFIVDSDLKRGKFDVIAEFVAGAIVAQLRAEEMQRYGLGGGRPAAGTVASQYSAYQQQPAAPAAAAAPYGAPAAPAAAPVDVDDVSYAQGELPYVPEDEIDRSIDYGEYTFNSETFMDQGYDAATQQMGQPCLVNLTNNRSYPLNKPSVVMGRGTDTDIAISDINASRVHAEINDVGGGIWHIKDLNSTNGTKVNGDIVGEFELQDGDTITIGMTSFTFTYR